MSCRVAVIGGGAAGFFGAIAAAEEGSEVHLFEGGAKPLSKVAISGGGRCNLTHHCFLPQELIKNYPRGSRELLGPFTRFGPQETVDWFTAHGVQVKAESDGRMFPVSDRSESVINALMSAAKEAGVILYLRSKIQDVRLQNERYVLGYNDTSLEVDRILLATGSGSLGWRIAESLGHTITERAPSLFTFEVDDPRIKDFPGTSFQNVALELRTPDGAMFRQAGPLLITHWGFSGPAVLKLSAWAARELARSEYRGELLVNFCGSLSSGDCCEQLKKARREDGRSFIGNAPMFGVSRRFWGGILHSNAIAPEQLFSDVSNQTLERLAEALTKAKFTIRGKGEFKDEFVTCGGVKLSEVDFRTMESKRSPGLYFAGEILDLDGVTGGFNFQAAWTTGWHAGRGMASSIE